MQRAGEVVEVAQGVAIVQCPGEEHPEIGTVVIDERLDSVGRVVDVFGPTDRPYLAVTPNDSVRLPPLLGSVLYYRSD
ncbi:MAG: H/ACA ribonucleoprotein complex subunit GAR1 [Halapricum sp.]